MHAVVRIALVALACAVSALPAAADAEERHLRRDGVDAYVWTPSGDPSTRAPVVVFSHGIRLCANQSRFITEAFAAAGYLVIAPNHADANCSFNREAREERSGPQEAAATPHESDARNRAGDVRAALAALAADPDLAPRADLSRVALAGHSLGGYTVLAMGGALPAWKLAGVKAIVAFAPYTLPLADVGDLEAPVMYEVGTLDPLFTLPVAGLGGAYDRSPPPKYLVQVAGAGHYAWTDDGASGKEAIVDYAIAFLDCYVKGAVEGPLLQSARPGVASFRRDVHRG